MADLYSLVANHSENELLSNQVVFRSLRNTVGAWSQLGRDNSNKNVRRSIDVLP